MAILPRASDGTFNYVGKLTDFLPEGATWGMPSSGLSVQLVISAPDKVGPTDFSLKSPKWNSPCKLEIDGLKFDGSSFSGAVSFKNTSGMILDGVRFDIVSATETYKGKDPQGKEVELTRPQSIAEESPILFGDVAKDASCDAVPCKATGFKWNTESVSIQVDAKLSGLTFVKSLWDEHSGSFLDFDTKGRLLMGSGKQPAIYRADSTTGKLDVVTSTPEASIQLGVNPTDGTICANWLNSHNFTFFSAGGDEITKIDEDGEVEGMQSWPQMGRYDAKGNLYLEFGSCVAQMSGGKPALVLKGAGQFEFHGYTHFDVARDGSLFIASGTNVFRFEPGGKNPKKIIQGPDDPLGRIHGYSAIRMDPNGFLWIADAGDGEFPQRISVFDSNGKLVWVFGRGGPKMLDGGEVYESQVTTEVKSIAASSDGQVFIATNGAHSVLEFAEF